MELPTDINFYDLGASCHMSGFCHCFMNFIKIAQKPITTADRRFFSAVGKGDPWAYSPMERKRCYELFLLL